MLERAVATPFLRRGVDSLGRSELVYLFSGEYGWMGPRQAEDAVDRAVEAGLLTETGDGESVAPSFDREAVELLDADAEFGLDDLSVDDVGGGDRDGGSIGDSDGVFDQAVERLAADGYSRKEAVAEINRQHRRLGAVDVEAAAVLAVKRNGGPVDDLVELSLQQLQR